MPTVSRFRWTMVAFATAITGILLCVVFDHAATPKKTFLWIEGEDATKSDVKPHPWWYDQVQRDKLSGGRWLHHFDEKVAGTAEYNLNIDDAGEYFFWLHANPVKAKLSYQLDKGDWQLVDTSDKKVTGLVNIAADNKPDLRFIAWIDVGKLKLDAGKHVLRFKFHSDPQHHGGIDVIVLSKAFFRPDGLARPDKGTTRFDDKNSWAFEPKTDPFKNDALLDLRYLNEKTAGEKGFVKLNARGDGFVLGDGSPVRFWAVCDGVYNKSDADLAYHARFLAKLGVNMVRMHGSMSPKGPGKKIDDVDQEEIEKAWRLVAAMKKEGIYTTLSPFWANGGHAGVAASWGIEGYGDKADIWALLFFRDDLKAAYKAWTRALLTKPNPLTGIPLGQDPAVAILQVQNEDSLFFWTLQGVKPAQLQILGQRFAVWLKKQYGSLEAASKAWQGQRADGDAFADGKVGILPTWQMTVAHNGGMAQRVRDQVRFLAETQRDFYAEIAHFFRDELGCKQLINASNWITADPEKLNDIERWTYTSTDVQAVNKYYGGGPHEGPNNGWRIDPGDFFEGRSALKNPTALPTNLKQVVGQPMLITESCWTFPLAYESEGPFLIAAYGGLTGVGPYYWFAAGNPSWCTEPYFPYQTFPDGQKGVGKWELHPGTETQFPAAALLYRRGDVQQSAAVVHEERPLDDLWSRKAPLLAEGRSFDPNRQTRFAEGAEGKTAIDPLAFLAGRIEVRYDGSADRSTHADLGKLIDPVKKTVQSATGQLLFDYGVGLCKLDTPRAQGVTGFLSAAGGKVTLTDATIQSGNTYASVSLVSLDGKSLAESEKVLVQVGTIARPTGWTTRAATWTTDDKKTTYQGEKVVHTGQMPWRFVNTDVSVTLRNVHLSRATQLDVGGYEVGPIDLQINGASRTLKLPANCIYAVLRK